MAAIVDQFGRPFTRKPTKALADIVKLRRPQPLSAQTAMSVDTLAATMLAADEGDIDAYVELATEMEERDLHYFGQLSTRKLALVGKPAQAVAGDTGSKNGSKKKRQSVGKDKTLSPGEEIAQVWQETVLEDDAFPGLVLDLADALGKGFSVVQAVWDTRGEIWGFESFEHVPSESLTFFPALSENAQRPLTDHDLHLILQDGKYARLADLPGLYLIHHPHLRTGMMIRGGFARIAARNFLLKNFTVKEWLAFAEVYGMPLRYATYDPDTIREEEKATIAIALANLGHDASAMVPRSVELQILGEAARTGNGGSFDLLCRYLDEQLSKAIQGQTMTADNGSSKSQSETHKETQIDYTRADALATQQTLRHLARAWTSVNYGPNAPVPRTRFAVDPPADLTAWTLAVLPWVSAGLAVSRTQVLDKLDLSEPEGPEDEIEIVANIPPEPGDEPGAPPKKKPAKPGKAAHRTDALTGWDHLIQPHVDELEALAADAGSYEAFKDAIELSPSKPLIERLVLEAIAARATAERNGP